MTNIQGLGKWELVYSHGIVKQAPQRRIELELPTLFTSPYILVDLASVSAKPHWWLAGNIIQYAQSIDIQGLFSDEELTNTADIGRHRVGLGERTVLKMQPLVPEYRIWFQSVPWIDSILIKVWEYVGTIDPSVEAELLDLVRIDLLRIESKIDNL